jgi:hypothetical protein
VFGLVRVDPEHEEHLVHGGKEMPVAVIRPGTEEYIADPGHPGGFSPADNLGALPPQAIQVEMGVGIHPHKGKTQGLRTWSG